MNTTDPMEAFFKEWANVIQTPCKDEWVAKIEQIKVEVIKELGFTDVSQLEPQGVEFHLQQLSISRFNYPTNFYKDIEGKTVEQLTKQLYFMNLLVTLKRTEELLVKEQVKELLGQIRPSREIMSKFQTDQLSILDAVELLKDQNQADKIIESNFEYVKKAVMKEFKLTEDQLARCGLRGYLMSLAGMNLNPLESFEEELKYLEEPTLREKLKWYNMLAFIEFYLSYKGSTDKGYIEKMPANVKVSNESPMADRFDNVVKGQWFHPSEESMLKELVTMSIVKSINDRFTMNVGRLMNIGVVEADIVDLCKNVVKTCLAKNITNSNNVGEMLKYAAKIFVDNLSPADKVEVNFLIEADSESNIYKDPTITGKYVGNGILEVTIG